MASKTLNMSTWSAKRIIGDNNTSSRSEALLQTGANTTSNIWILANTNRSAQYGIFYVYDTNGTADILEFYGGHTITQNSTTTDVPTVKIQLDNGNIETIGLLKVGSTLEVGGTSIFHGYVGIGTDSDDIRSSGSAYLTVQNHIKLVSDNTSANPVVRKDIIHLDYDTNNNTILGRIYPEDDRLGLIGQSTKRWNSLYLYNLISLSDITSSSSTYHDTINISTNNGSKIVLDSTSSQVYRTITLDTITSNNNTALTMKNHDSTNSKNAIIELESLAPQIVLDTITNDSSLSDWKIMNNQGIFTIRDLDSSAPITFKGKHDKGWTVEPRLYINTGIPENDPSYALKVNGTSYLGGNTELIAPNGETAHIYLTGTAASGANRSSTDTNTQIIFTDGTNDIVAISAVVTPQNENVLAINPNSSSTSGGIVLIPGGHSAFYSGTDTTLTVNASRQSTYTFKVGGTSYLGGDARLVAPSNETAHLYMTGTTSTSIDTTSQIVFLNGDSEVVAISAFDDSVNGVTINPSSSTDTGNISLVPGGKSHFGAGCTLTVNGGSQTSYTFKVNGTSYLGGDTRLVAPSSGTAHLYMTGTASNSKNTTSQIVFLDDTSEVVAISAFVSSSEKALIINPSSSSTTGYIALIPGGHSTFSSGTGTDTTLTVNDSRQGTYTFKVNGTSYLGGNTSLIAPSSGKAHLYLTGTVASGTSRSSKNTDTQIIFTDGTNDVVAISAIVTTSNENALTINPSSSSTAGNIILIPGGHSAFTSSTGTDTTLTINASRQGTYTFKVGGTSYLNGDTTLAAPSNGTAHLYMTGTASSSKNTTSQIVFLNGTSEVVAISAFDGSVDGIAINPSSSSNTGNISLVPGGKSQFGTGCTLTINDSSQTSYTFKVSGNSFLGRDTAASTSLLSSQLIVANTTSSSPGSVGIELYRGDSKGCWQILNDSGHFRLKTNYTSAYSATYDFTALTIAQSTLKATFAGAMQSNGGILTLVRETSDGKTNSAYINFQVKDTTLNQTQNKGYIACYHTGTADNNGMNMVIRTAGNVIIGGGESAGTLYTDVISGTTTENLYCTADTTIYLEAGAQTFANRKGFYINSNGNVIPCAAETSTNEAQNLGSSSAKWATVYATTLSGNATSASKVGEAASWLYFHHSNEVNFGGTFNSNATIYFGYRAVDSRSKPDTYIFGSGSGGTAVVKASKVYSAIWNDYAECRMVETEEPGYCVIETSSGTMVKSYKRLQPGCKITSDTFGTCMGKTDTAKTPIAVAGRVLVYPYRAPEEYTLGAAVCSAPNGTVDIMTRDEVMMYPERIVGTVSEIPTYEVWQGGNQDGDNDIQVKGRIWIYVR